MPFHVHFDKSNVFEVKAVELDNLTIPIVYQGFTTETGRNIILSEELSAAIVVSGDVDECSAFIIAESVVERHNLFGAFSVLDQNREIGGVGLKS